MQSRKISTPIHCLLSLVLLLGASLAKASELDIAQRQWLAGQRSQAVTTVEKALAVTPNELKLRFALGVMRMELGEQAAAIELFTALTQDYPDIAEPYNNLAVIRAARGELDQAQKDLEQALRLQPTHAQAQENLGDVLLRLAARAFQRAQQAQTAPSVALKQKLKRTQDLLSLPQGPSSGDGQTPQ
ncbi:tetratricopeptide repeat protein [Paucibacter sp. AS339]|uniref:tetratricopeptide repeat protein n=1 Tax=Paucibacter hankyongi TaxID=3133434 RepID=UPI0030A65E26